MLFLHCLLFLYLHDLTPGNDWFRSRRRKGERERERGWWGGERMEGERERGDSKNKRITIWGWFLAESSQVNHSRGKREMSKGKSGAAKSKSRQLLGLYSPTKTIRDTKQNNTYTHLVEALNNVSSGSFEVHPSISEKAHKRKHTHTHTHTQTQWGVRFKQAVSVGD